MGSQGNKKDIEDLIKKLEKQGFDVELRKGGHFGVSKDGGPTVFMPRSPSDYRGIHRVISKLKKIGYDRNA